MFRSGFKESKVKPQLKMAVHRFGIASNKKTAIISQQKREIATLLATAPPKEEKARIRAEAIIREDNTIEAYEILQLTCEILSERLRLIASEKECPPDLKSSVSTLIWSSARVDIPELVEIRKQFRAKYGKKFEEDAISNVGGVLNERVFAKLSVQPPSFQLVQAYLGKIAEEFDVEWEPAQTSESAVPFGYSVRMGLGSGYGIPVVEGEEPKFQLGGTPTVEGIPGAYAIPTAPSFKNDPNYAQATVLPYVPSPGPSSRQHDMDEPDIYVPKIEDNAKKDDDDDDSDDLDALKAQFAKLNKP